jgi:hypothetical protein
MSHADMLFVRTDGGFGGVCHRQALHMVGVSWGFLCTCYQALPVWKRACHNFLAWTWRKQEASISMERMKICSLFWVLREQQSSNGQYCAQPRLCSRLFPVPHTGESLSWAPARPQSTYWSCMLEFQTLDIHTTSFAVKVKGYCLRLAQHAVKRWQQQLLLTSSSFLDLLIHSYTFPVLSWLWMQRHTNHANICPCGLLAINGLETSNLCMVRAWNIPERRRNTPSVSFEIPLRLDLAQALLNIMRVPVSTCAISGLQ